MSSDGIKWQPIDGLARRKRGIGSIMCERGEGENREGKDADSRMCRTHEAAELCRTEGAEIPVLFRDLISGLCFVIEEVNFHSIFEVINGI